MARRGLWAVSAGAVLAAAFAGSIESLAAAQAHGQKLAVVIIDDVSSPAELKQNGIEPADPETLAHFFDAITAGNFSCTVIYIPVREQAARGVPVICEARSFIEDPPSPPPPGLKLPDLQKSWKAYRNAKDAYDERFRVFQAQREETREKFIRGALDALATAEVEVSALRRRKRDYQASDIEGTIVGAVATLKTTGATAGILVLNTDLNDQVTHRHRRVTPLKDDELPPSLIRGLVMVNTSFKPDSSPLIAKTPIAKHHAQSVKAAADFAANLLPAIQ